MGRTVTTKAKVCRASDQQGKCPESRMLSTAWRLSSLVGCANSLPQAAPPLGSLCTLQAAGWGLTDSCPGTLGRTGTLTLN